MVENDEKIYFLHQDNDPKHNSLKCRSSLDDLNIRWVINIRIYKFKNISIISFLNGL